MGLLELGVLHGWGVYSQTFNDDVIVCVLVVLGIAVAFCGLGLVYRILQTITGVFI